MMTMLTHDECLAKALEMEALAETSEHCHSYSSMASAWRRLALQSQWQDSLLAIVGKSALACPPADGACGH